MIPKRIWQTYKTKSLPRVAKPCVQTWKRLNPAWTYQLADDREIERLVAEHLGKDALKIFLGFPLPVMKADLWRYAILHKWGGTYADIDTVCNVPIKNWSTGGKGLIASVENASGIHFCQWTISAVPAHPLLSQVIELVLRRAKDGINTDYEHFVHYHTGPGVWTEAIRMYLGVAEPDPPLDVYGYPNDDLRANVANVVYGRDKLWSGRDITLLDNRKFNGDYVTHLSASSRWAGDSQYDSWIEHRNKT